MSRSIIKFPFEEVLSTQTANIESADTILFDGRPIEPVYTLVARPNETITNVLWPMKNKLSSLISSGLYFYDKSQYHFTIVGEVPAKINQNELEKIFTSILPHYLLAPNYKGLQINPRGICVGVYFTKDELFNLRKELRKHYPFKDFNSSLADLNHIGWLNLARFTEPLSETTKSVIFSLSGHIFWGRIKAKNRILFDNK